MSESTASTFAWISPCHGAAILASLGDGVLMGSCAECYETVCRINPRTGEREWLAGESPWSARDDLPKMVGATS